MPDSHRIRFVGFCARREVEELMKTQAINLFESKLKEVEVYADQLEYQAKWLNQINQSQSNIIIPIEVRKVNQFGNNKVIWATNTSKKKNSTESEYNHRFMIGPEPSWLKN
ncbi:hypothetical protein CROQUDRAFT_666716, partial [Cronartium quercuum f. sp. fusiforme G11]